MVVLNRVILSVVFWYIRVLLSWIPPQMAGNNKKAKLDDLFIYLGTMIVEFRVAVEERSFVMWTTVTKDRRTLRDAETTEYNKIDQDLKDLKHHCKSNTNINQGGFQLIDTKLPYKVYVYNHTNHLNYNLE